jgi:hypothetical protein
MNLIQRNLHSHLYNFINNKYWTFYVILFYVLTFSVTVLFAAHIQSARKNPPNSGTHATGQDIV